MDYTQKQEANGTKYTLKIAGLQHLLYDNINQPEGALCNIINLRRIIKNLTTQRRKGAEKLR